jgi:energy-converting hydrogenase Eha subunit A
MFDPERKRKRDKIRSAWISFAGRIAAQIIGAIATVTLGVVVLGKHAPATVKAAVEAPTVLIATPVRTHGETVIVMVPLGKDGVDQAFARRVAESFEKTKAAAPRQDARLQTPTGPLAPLSADPLADSRASLESQRE